MKMIGTLALVLAPLLAVTACSTGRSAETEGPRVSAGESILAGSRPGDGATVSGPVNELGFTFTNPVALVEVTVTGADGTIMPIMLSAAGEVTQYSIPVPGLETGRYSVSWRATARGNEHRGKFGFTVR